MHRYQYGYDKSGNRTAARTTLTNVAGMGTNHDNGRSWSYAYDDLNRLIDAHLGPLNSANDGPWPSGDPLPPGFAAVKRTQWDLDALGNWSGGTAQDGSIVRSTGGTVSSREHHNTDERNEINSVVKSGVTTNFVFDLNGNQVCDGTYVYQYDAFNRLLQVNVKGTATFNSAGRIYGGVLGSQVARYRYDGLGRLIQKLTPLTKGSTAYQCKDFYYDGVRRITETIFRPELSFVMIDPSMVEEGSNGLEYVFVEKEQNDEAAKLAPEENEESMPGGGGGVEEPIELIEMGQPEGEVWTDREYIYGTDYVDEFVAQVDRDETLIYLHQDANHNVVALTAGMAGDPNIFLPPAGTLMSQYTWDPYGTVAAVDIAHIHAVNRIGHQGLFFERLDGGNDTPPLATNSRGFYYNRNRLYSPSLGRFMQRDPNETGVPLLTALASNGQEPVVELGAFDALKHFGDGISTFSYQGENPINGSDPAGLFDNFDEAIWDYEGEAIATTAVLKDSLGYAFEMSGLIADVTRGLSPDADLGGMSEIAMDGASSFADFIFGFNLDSSIGFGIDGTGGNTSFARRAGVGSSAARTVISLLRIGSKAASRIELMATKSARAGLSINGAMSALKHIGKIGKYSDMQKLTVGYRSAIQAHHILESRIARMLKLKVANIPAIVLTRGQHQIITNAIRAEIEFGARIGRNLTKKKVLEVYERVYTRLKRPDLFQKIQKYLQ